MKKILLILIIFYTGKMHSQNINFDTIESLLLQEIIIHSSLNTEDNKTQIIRINQKKISNSLSKNTAELLEKATSISIQKSQNGGGSPNIRGFEANRILLVQDDVKMNNTIYRSGHLQNILSIDKNIIENLSVLHGPSSIFYGSGALGGAIIINTINPHYFNEQTIFSSQIESSSKSFTTHIHNISKFKKADNLFSLSYQNYGDLKMGNNRLHNYPYWGIEEFATKGNTQLFSKYSQINIVNKTYFKLNNKQEIYWNNQYSTTSNIDRFDKLNDITDSLPKYKYWFYGPQENILSSLKFTDKKITILKDKTNLLVSYQKNKESRNQQKYSEENGIHREEKIQILDTKLSFEKLNMNWAFNYGLSYRFQYLNSTADEIINGGGISSTMTRYPNNGSNVNNISTFLLSEYTINSNLKWFNGIRYDFEKIDMNFKSDNLIDLGSKIEVDNGNVSINSNLTIYFKQNNFVSVSIYNSFRNPNIDDLGKVFSKNNNIVVVPNINLKSEKILSTEIMYQFKNPKKRLELALFASNLNDAIEKREITINGQDSILFDGEMMKMIANTNIKSAIMYGFNSSYNYNISKRLNINFNTSLVRSKSSDALPLAHIPPFSFRGELKYKIFKLDEIVFYSKYNSWKRSVDFDLSGVDNLDEATIDGTPSWYTLNIRFKKSINKFHVSIACENILDSHYKTFSSAISSSGRNFMLNLQSEF